MSTSRADAPTVSSGFVKRLSASVFFVSRHLPRAPARNTKRKCSSGFGSRRTEKRELPAAFIFDHSLEFRTPFSGGIAGGDGCRILNLPFHGDGIEVGPHLPDFADARKHILAGVNPSRTDGAAKMAYRLRRKFAAARSHRPLIEAGQYLKLKPLVQFGANRRVGGRQQQGSTIGENAKTLNARRNPRPSIEAHATFTKQVIKRVHADRWSHGGIREAHVMLFTANSASSLSGRSSRHTTQTLFATPSAGVINRYAICLGRESATPICTRSGRPLWAGHAGCSINSRPRLKMCSAYRKTTGPLPSVQVRVRSERRVFPQRLFQAIDLRANRRRR